MARRAVSAKVTEFSATGLSGVRYTSDISLRSHLTKYQARTALRDLGFKTELHASGTACGVSNSNKNIGCSGI